MSDTDLTEVIGYMEDDVRYLIGMVQDLLDAVDTLRRDNERLRKSIEQLATGHPYAALTMLGLDPAQLPPAV